MQAASSGRSVVVVGNAMHVCGFIALEDGVRSQAARAIGELKAAGIKRVVMLTGDNEPTAASVARSTHVDAFFAELLPQDKVRIIEKLLADGSRVAMVGDGVNDAPALARASLGIAMGAAGTDAAIETADVALMSDDLSKLAWLVRHSRRTVSIIRQNIVFSLAVKGIFVALSVGGVASLWAAIAADMGASLLVVFNGLRLLGTGRVAAVPPLGEPPEVDAKRRHLFRKVVAVK
jgi:Cd2+/Zn2+-exporting ATPase